MDNGVMADRILEMADLILAMADNIGLTADQIIATRQLQNTNYAPELATPGFVMPANAGIEGPENAGPRHAPGDAIRPRRGSGSRAGEPSQQPGTMRATRCILRPRSAGRRPDRSESLRAVFKAGSAAVVSWRQLIIDTGSKGGMMRIRSLV